MTDILFVYVTVPKKDIAIAIAHCVVEENFAACANIVPGVTSVYSWQGKVEEAEEVILILKTTVPLFHKLETRIRGLHPHETPCIVGLPVTVGAADFLNWVHASTRQC